MGIEPMTYFLPRSRSTTEPRRHLQAHKSKFSVRSTTEPPRQICSGRPLNYPGTINLILTRMALIEERP